MNDIANPEQHHRKPTSQEEFLALLKKNIQYDRRYIGQ
jgi:hypothetical protein